MIRSPKRASARPVCACFCLLVVLPGIAVSGVHQAEGAEPLHVLVDRIWLASGPGLALGPDQNLELCNDATYLRRVYLDLWGRIPSAEETRRFLADTSTEKRSEVVERLLSSPQYALQMANVFDVMLMERRGQKHIPLEEWRDYLYQSFLANKPWNTLVQEILAADGTEERTRPAARFSLARDADPNLLTRDVGRILFGMDLQCCQCHDHPLIGSYLQSDYYGIYAFFSRGYVFTDPEKKIFYAEKAEGQVEFTSVFTEQRGTTLPRLPGDFEIQDPLLLHGQEYEVAPTPKVRPVPTYSRRARLAELVASMQSLSFNRNIVNRLWAHMMGRGLVEPLDLHHPDNPATHPQLLRVMADAFAEGGHDIQSFLRELARTAVYQRSLQLPVSPGARDADVAASLADQVQDASARRETAAEALATARAALETVDLKLAEERGRFDSANAKLADATKKRDSAAQKLAEATAKLQAKQELSDALQAAAANAQQAASRLEDDEVLVAAAATFVDRAQKCGEELKPLTASVEELTPPAQQAEQEVTRQREAAQGILQEFERELAQRRGLLEAARLAQSAYASAENDWLASQAVLDTTRNFAAFQSRQAQLAGLQEQRTAAARELENDRTRAEEAKRLLAEKEAALAAIQKEAAATSQELATAGQQHATLDETLKLVAEAAARSEAAAARLEKDAELQQAATNVKTRHDQLVKQLAQLKQGETELAQAAARQQQQAGEAAEQMAQAQQAVLQATDRVTGLSQTLVELDARIAAAQADVENSRQDWLALACSQLLTAALKPLTPEEMAYSALQATGARAIHERAAQAEVDKNLPIEEGSAADSQRRLERDRALHRAVRDKLKDQVTVFVNLFGHAAGQPQEDFFATVDQALFFANSDTVLSWLKPAEDNLLARVQPMEDPAAVAQELYLTILTREPDDEEVQRVRDYLAERPEDKLAALQELAWALLTSVEFRFRS